MLTKVHLHGNIGDKYGKTHEFDIDNVAQAAQALAANYPSFFYDFKDGFYEIKIGDSYIDEESLRLGIGNKKDVHITPCIGGSKNGGGIKAIAGIALLAVAVIGSGGFGAIAAGGFGTFGVAGLTVSYGSVALIGLSLTLQGVSGLLTPTPKTEYSGRESPDKRASFIFNGATNRSEEGATIPLVYGKFITGSVLVSAGLTIEQLL